MLRGVVLLRLDSIFGVDEASVFLTELDEGDKDCLGPFEGFLILLPLLPNVEEGRDKRLFAWDLDTVLWELDKFRRLSVWLVLPVRLLAVF